MSVLLGKQEMEMLLTEISRGRIGCSCRIGEGGEAVKNDFNGLSTSSIKKCNLSCQVSMLKISPRYETVNTVFVWDEEHETCSEKNKN